MKATLAAVALLTGGVMLHLSAGLPDGATFAALWEGEGMAATLFWNAELPRIVMALLVGAALGLAGTTMQQITRNPLASPSTLGTVAGAWVSLSIATLVAPVFAAQYGVWICLAGGLGVTALVLAVSGFSRMEGITVIVVGMATNLFLGGAALIIALMHGETVRAVFVWVAGDLTQTGWSDARWLAPQILIGTVGLLALVRPLTLLRLGQDAARARGLATVPLSIILLSLAVWLTSASIAMVGAIGFIGLIAPNLVRLFNIRHTAPTLLLGAVAGAGALVLTDALPVALTDWSRTLIPSGSSAALIGAPALIFIAMRQVRGQEAGSFQMLSGLPRPRGFTLPLVIIAGALSVALGLGIGASPQGPQWLGGLAPQLRDLTFSFRWPSVIAAAGAGAALAVVGTILQRLLRNPLASPDVLGVTAGATFTAVASVVFLGLPPAETAIPGAFIGSLCTLAFLTLIWRRSETPPALLVLTGISLAAMLDALVQFAMAKAGGEANMLLTWLTGATSLVTPTGALALLAVAGLMVAGTLGLRRWLDLLSMGESVATARGLDVEMARRVLLLLVATGTATVVAWVGPIAFVGLIAPHAAAMLGARTSGQQIIAASALGTCLLVVAELVGRLAIYPNQVPTGAIATLIGGAYLFGLLLFTLLGRKRAY